MGLGAAMAGGNPDASRGRQKNDFYRTEPEATHALLGAEHFPGVIHECACGDGAIGRVLEQKGYKVVANDIEPQGYGVKRDFFTITHPVGHCIVTNPPFDIADKFIVHALEVLRPVKLALLLKATYFHADTRRPLFERHKPKFIYPLTWRLDFLGLGRPTMECSWYVWYRGNSEYPQYRLLSKPEEFRRRRRKKDHSHSLSAI